MSIVFATSARYVKPTTIAPNDDLLPIRAERDRLLAQHAQTAVLQSSGLAAVQHRPDAGGNADVLERLLVADHPRPPPLAAFSPFED